MSKRLFGTNGIRGKVNQDITPELAVKIGAAIGTFFGEESRLFIGYDGRTSSPMISRAVISGLISAGCLVYDVGLAPTPAIQYAVKHFKPDGGVIITASHNPPQYNGIKVLGGDGIEIPREDEVKIEKFYFSGKFNRVEWSRLGKATPKPGILDLYKEAVKRHVDVSAIAQARLKVVVDPGNGVGALVTPYLLREMGCKVVTINSDIDGNFPGRLPEPTPDHLTELAMTVKAVNADLGVAHDGDADRAIFSDERGTIHWGDRSFAIIEKFFLEEKLGKKIVTPVSSSRIIMDVAEQYGGEIIWTKVGSIIVSQKMKEIGAKLGGEENGGVFYAPHQSVRDGAMTTSLILNIMAKSGKKFSELVSDLPTYYQGKDTVPCPNEFKQEVLEKLRKRVKVERIDTMDGIKIWLPDKSWLLIRPSGTEPVYRLYGEALDEEKIAVLIKQYKTLVKRIVEESSFS